MKWKVDGPMAAVVCVLILVVGGLQFSGKLPVQWVPLSTAVGMFVMNLLNSAIAAKKDE